MPYSESETKSLRDMQQRLRAITSGCRPDMHEPDENGITGVVSGTGFDNAYGDYVGEDGELVLTLRHEDGRKESFNLASLVALARL